MPALDFKRSLAVVFCIFVLFGSVRGDDWPQWLGPQRDGVWRESGIVAKFGPDGPKVRWRTPVGAGYSGPVVAQGKVIVTDRILAEGSNNPDNAFARSKAKGLERVLCLNEADGKLLWKREYPCAYDIAYAAGPRCTPVIDGDLVFTQGAMGNLLCLKLADGSVVWQHDLLKEYAFPPPIWGCAGHPLVDGDQLICLVGGKGSVLVAFDKRTGKEAWKNLSASEPGYAPPMIYEIGGVRQLVLWHPESVNGLEPATGKVYWSVPFGGRKGRGLKAGLSIPTPRLEGDRLFLTAFYEGSLMLKTAGTKKPEVLWKSDGRSEKPEDTEALHCIISTPVFEGKHVYGVCSYGELRCIEADSGKRVWSTHAATGGKSLRWGNAFLVKQGDRYVLFNEQGDLILARLSPKGYEEISRANILTPTNTMAPPPGRRVIWMHPAFANRSVYARNDREIVCVSLADQ